MKFKVKKKINYDTLYDVYVKKFLFWKRIGTVFGETENEILAKAKIEATKHFKVWYFEIEGL